jgi:hypothetical protein
MRADRALPRCPRATHWRLRGTIRGRCKIGLVIARSSTPCAIYGAVADTIQGLLARLKAHQRQAESRSRRAQIRSTPANNGRVIVIGNRGEVTINPRELMARRAAIRGLVLPAITPAEEADIHAGLFAGLEDGTLRPVVGKELPLAEAARAHEDILKPGSAGKIVLIC